MPYTNNPQMPRIRNQAAELVRRGWSCRRVGRYFGFHHTAVSGWVKQIKTRGYGPLPTHSSRPKSHPHQLSEKVVGQIVQCRLQTGRCAEVVHRQLAKQGVSVSLSSVKRVLERHYLIKKRSPWKHWHREPHRPVVAQPGSLVQVDTVHVMRPDQTRIYVFTLLDLYSRWAFARASESARAGDSLHFVRLAQAKAPFPFQFLQTDHGSEFSKYFHRQVKLNHRHSRVRRPNDNAHLERFNRTLREECLNQVAPELKAVNRALTTYLKFYNDERLHLGIDLKTPREMVGSY